MKRRSARLVMTLVLAGAWTAGQVSAEPLGRLFLSPERRAALERQRQLNIQAAQTLEGSNVSVDGVVVRSSGRNTVWINQHPQTERGLGTGVTASITPGNPSRVTIAPGDDPPAALRVGETLNRNTREKADILGSGRIAVSRPR